MFCLSLIEHTLRLPADLLGLSLEKAVRHELEALFLDKVIAKLGLCVSVYDIKRISGGLIFPGDGAPTYTVRCRLIMFRPFVGEIIEAKLMDCDENSIQLSLGFFDDIYVPSHLLPSPSRYKPDPEDGNRRIWVWEYQTEDVDTNGVVYSIDDNGSAIRFRVHSVTYPPIPLEAPSDAKPVAPMVITGSIDSNGLGPVGWWE